MFRYLHFVFAFLFCLQSSSFGASNLSLRAYAYSLLPKKLQKLEPGTTTRQKVESLLGKAVSQREDGTAWYQLKEVEADITVAFQGDVVRYFIYVVPADEFLGQDSFKPWIGSEIEKRWKQESEEIPERHTGEHSVMARFIEEGIELNFSNVAERRLQTLLFWKAGVSKP